MAARSGCSALLLGRWIVRYGIGVQGDHRQGYRNWSASLASVRATLSTFSSRPLRSLSSLRVPSFVSTSPMQLSLLPTMHTLAEGCCVLLNVHNSKIQTRYPHYTRSTEIVRGFILMTEKLAFSTFSATFRFLITNTKCRVMFSLKYFVALSSQLRASTTKRHRVVAGSTSSGLL